MSNCPNCTFPLNSEGECSACGYKEAKYSQPTKVENPIPQPQTQQYNSYQQTENKYDLYNPYAQQSQYGVYQVNNPQKPENTQVNVQSWANQQPQEFKQVHNQNSAVEQKQPVQNFQLNNVQQPIQQQPQFIPPVNNTQYKPVQNIQQPPVKQKKKGGCLKVFLIILGILFVLGILGAIAIGILVKYVADNAEEFAQEFEYALEEEPGTSLESYLTSELEALDTYLTAEEENKELLLGTWEEDSSVGWIITEDTAYWLKDVNDTEDNYWEGTYTFETGKEALEKAGFNTDNMRYTDEVGPNDYNVLTFYPYKIISGGEDKSDTNIAGAEEIIYAWVFVHHENGELEAQTINMLNYDTAYMMKVD